jgi:cytidylate kinase
MVITIDGGAGSGKSTVARALATRLGIAYLDTGAMYRAVAFAALQRQIDFADQAALLEVARAIKLELRCGPTDTRIFVDGLDASETIRSMEVSAHTPFVAKHPAIRMLLIEEQRRIGGNLGSFVSEGRDQGSVVFPDADAKFILEATLEKRAERRHQELQAGDAEPGFAEVASNLQERDGGDAVHWQPLLAAGAAVVIDTTELSVDQVVDRMAASLEGLRPPNR